MICNILNTGKDCTSSPVGLRSKTDFKQYFYFILFSSI